MKETEALIKRAQRYLKSDEILLKDRDNESCGSRTYYAMKNNTITSPKGLLAAGVQWLRVY